MEPLTIESYLSQGWKLSEFTHWITYKEKENFLSILGKEHFILLEELDVKVKKKWKAKMLISPVGVQILNLYFMPAYGHA